MKRAPSRRPRAAGAVAAPAPVALGFTVKSGWAAAVLLGGPPASPRVLATHRLDLSDPGIPDARQPYHAGFGTARSAGPRLARLLASVRRYGRRSVLGLIRQVRAEGREVAGAGIVVGSLLDPDRLGNAHVRIHALEGRLFRTVVEGAAGRSHLARAVWCERDLFPRAARVLRRTEPELRAALLAMPRPAPRPWRAEHKVAALAAWLVLAGGGTDSTGA